MQLFVASNKGKVRNQNEDCACMVDDDYYNYSCPEIAAEKRKYLLAVADGMGGHQAGEIASSMTISILLQEFLLKMAYWEHDHIKRSIKDIVADIGAEIEKKSESAPKYSGMGTTLTAVIICESNKAIVVHIGDSRLYLARNDELTQITEDHTYVNDLYKAGNITSEQIKNHPKRNVLTKAIGGGGVTEADLITLDLIPGDKLLLCTDGLSGMLEDEIIKETVQSEDGIQKACISLITQSNMRGGTDNITVGMAKI